MLSRQNKAWSMWENIGIGITNPRSCYRIPIPEDITKEELEELEIAIEKLEADDAIQMLSDYIGEAIPIDRDGRISSHMVYVMNQILIGTNYEVDSECYSAESGGIVLIKKNCAGR